MHVPRKKHQSVETEPWKPEKARKEGAKNNSVKEAYCLISTLYNQLECQIGGNECTYKAMRSNSVSRKIFLYA